jgi:transcriptional regulator with PAS, ATPase and Fis domain
VFDATRTLDGWTCQLLETATHVAALLLEIERAQGRSQGSRARPDGAAPLIGSSHAIRAVRERIERVAATDFTVLIEGESGTGKELVARQIHELSRRRRGPFVPVNCAAIVETLLEAELFGIEERTATGVRGRRGKFEHAHDGTLFLDEVSDLSPAAQAKLLRAIQDLSVERVGGCGPRKIDTRIIVATNRPLLSLVDHGRFRLDLYYRLHGVEVQVPPLRERREDVIELARYFLERHRLVRPLQLSAAAIDALIAYNWPGNVRELERVIERALALAGSDYLELDDLPPALFGGYLDVLMPSLRARESMRAWGSRYARLVLERCGNNKRQACRELGISYHTLRAYLRFSRAGSPHETAAQTQTERDPHEPSRMPAALVAATPRGHR